MLRQILRKNGMNNHIDNNKLVLIEFQKRMSSIVFGQNKLSDYKRTEEAQLGKGAYGIVFKAMFKQNANMIVAVKHVQCEMQNEGFPSTSIREISLLRELQSPYIVKLLDVVIEQKKLYLVFEFLNKDLKEQIDELKEKKKQMDPLLIKKLMFQLISGVFKIHEKRVVHRDLKPANILLDKDLNLKIADFGLARTYSIPTRPYSHEVVTLWYRAPEILLGSVEYSTPIDMWATGCIFAQMVIQKPLFQGDCQADQIYRIFRYLGTPNEQIWQGVSGLPEFKKDIPIWPTNEIQNTVNNLKLEDSGLHLLKSLLTYDPAKRITAKDALKHPYFNQLYESNL